MIKLMTSPTIGNQRYQSRGIPSTSFNYIPCQGLWKGLMELTDWKGLVFSIRNLVSKL